MLQLSGKLINRPVLSLRTGTSVATATEPIINPNNLKIEGFYCIDRYDKKKNLTLLYQDVREIISQGIVVNDYEVLVEQDEVVRLQDQIKLHFQLIGKPVVTESKNKLGKVNDFATEVETMYIQKIYIGQPLRKTLMGGSLSVDRSQIIEITNRRIIISDLLQATPARAAVPA